MSGSARVANVVIDPHRAAVENSARHTRKIRSNTAGNGPADLSGGRSDSALPSEPLDIVIAVPEIAGCESSSGDLGKGFARIDRKSKIMESRKIQRLIAIVTMGAASPKAKEMIEAFSAAVGR